MTTQVDEHGVPRLTLGWRLKIALGDESAQEMADYLGVSRQTLSRWMGDKGAPPRRAYIAQWALRTGVNVTWLETGTAPRPDGPGGGEELPRLDSNQQPSGYRFTQVTQVVRRRPYRPRIARRPGRHLEPVAA